MDRIKITTVGSLRHIITKSGLTKIKKATDNVFINNNN